MRYLWNTGFAIIALGFVLFLQGALPFLGLPTLGQAVWSMGFAHSFGNESWFSIYAHNFGQPEPAAISFGLSAAWPASLLISLGLHAADAYAVVAALWFSIAFWAARKIARDFGVASFPASLAACVWMSMPVIWAHAGYSMLSFGIALLPFYFMISMRLFLLYPAARDTRIKAFLSQLFAMIIAVFMDGYSYMMFAAGSSLMLAYAYFFFPEHRQQYQRFVIPAHGFCLGLSYALYAAYIGRLSYEANPADFFRGWGVDLMYLAIPTQGMHWIFDWLQWSVFRTNKQHFGDASVWTTTFCLPILLAGVVAAWRIKGRNKLMPAVLLVGVFGLYMSLGPSLKVNSTRASVPQSAASEAISPLMPAEYAVMPTGNSLLYMRVPGFKSMRASYRWSALGIMGFWLLFVLWIARKPLAGGVPVAVPVMLAIVALNLPNLPNRLKGEINQRKMFFAIDRDLVGSFEASVHKNERVIFLPWRNDFLINYLAARTNIRAYNIGGDKNLAQARPHWPASLSRFAMRELAPEQASSIAALLKYKDADVVVIPYFDALWAAHLWPCPAFPMKSPEQVNSLAALPGCPAFLKKQFAPVVEHLKVLPNVVVSESEFFAVVRVNEAYVANHEELIPQVSYPIVTNKHGSGGVTDVLVNGWYPLEDNFVWSSSKAVLRLPVPSDCQDKRCEVLLSFQALAATPSSASVVNFRWRTAGESWNKSMTVRDSGEQTLRVPFLRDAVVGELEIEVPEARSPASLSLNADERKLGIALRQIELFRAENSVAN